MKTEETMKALWQEYCLKSTLHGLRYVAEVKKSIWEKIVWLCLLLMAAVFVFYHLFACWTLFLAAPIQITIDDPRYPISKIDFPAVTVCPINKVLYSKALNLYNRLINKNVSLNSFMNTMLIFSLMRYPFYNHPLEFTQFEDIDLYFLENSNIKDTMLEVMPSIDEVFSHCFWRGNRYNCSELLRLQYTEEGFCYSFNSKTAERNSNLNNVPPFMNKNRKLVSLKNNAAGKITGFEFVLKSLDLEYLPKDKRIKGFNVMVHNPDDFPDVSKDYMVYTHYRKVFRMSIKATIVTTDESLNTLNVKQRRCILNHDTENGKLPSLHRKYNHLAKFASNSENNCYTKCRMQAIYEKCNCTPYFLRLYDKAPYCGIQHIRCLGMINVLQRNYLSSEEEGFPNWSLPMYMKCNCLQPCSFISYQTEVRITYSDILYGDNHSLYIDVMYNELYAVKYKRFLKYNAQDLLVSFGGVASLFLGCSFVSIAELIYYAIRSLLHLNHQRFRNYRMNYLLKWLQKLIRFNSLNIRKPKYNDNSIAVYPYVP